MKTVIVSGHESFDACGWYRGDIPWADLAKRGHCQVKFIPNPQRGELRQADALFLLRPSTNIQLMAAQRARGLGVPIWCDYDDDLFEVQDDNPSAPMFQSPATQGMMELFLQMADVVTVTTECLRNAMAGRTKAPVEVIPNAIDDRLMSFERHEKRPKHIVWRGGPSHDRDLLEYSEYIAQLARDFENRWIFMGYRPWWAKEKIKDPVCIGPTSGEDRTMVFFRALHALRPWLGIVPLHDNHFNRCKSNIALLEFALAGAAVVAPDWPEWNMVPGAHFYSTRPGFYDATAGFLNGDFDVEKAAKQTWEFVRDQFRLSIVNDERLRILANL